MRTFHWIVRLATYSCVIHNTKRKIVLFNTVEFNLEKEINRKKKRKK